MGSFRYGKHCGMSNAGMARVLLACLTALFALVVIAFAPAPQASAQVAKAKMSTAGLEVQAADSATVLRKRGLPIPKTYKKGLSTWKVEDGEVYLYAAGHKGQKKRKVTGLARVGTKTYYLGTDGVRRVGWTRVAPSYYAFFAPSTTEEGGEMVKSATVYNIKLGRYGYAKLTKASYQELVTLTMTNDMLQELTQQTWTKEKKLQVCFDYMSQPYGHFSFKVWREYKDYAKQHHAFARELITTKSGDCISWATLFTYLTYQMGYTNSVYAMNNSHSWTDIGGLIYDPQWSILHSRTYGIHYGELPGADPYKRYYIAETHRIVRSSSELSGKKIKRVKLKEKRRVVRFRGSTYYADSFGFAHSKWVKYGGNTYHFSKGGEANTGSVKLSRKGKSAYYVFDSKGRLSVSKSIHFVTVGSNTYLVRPDGRAAHGMYNGTFYLADGTTGTGIQVLNGKFYALTDAGSLDEDLSNKLNAAAAQGADASTLLSLLGEPKHVEETASCLNYGGNEGTDIVYTYDDFKVQTFKSAATGEIFWRAW